MTAQPSRDDQKQLEETLDRILAKAERHVGQINLTPDGVEFGNFEGLVRYCRYLLESGFCPKGVDTVPKVVVCVTFGRKLGLDAMTSVQCIAPINGRPTLYGDLPLAVCRQHPEWLEEGFEEYFEVNGQRIVGNPKPDDFKLPTTRCVVTSQRRGAKGPQLHTFSVADANAAGLFGKNGSLYGPYPHRMLRYRARGYNLRDNFGDALKGMGIGELADHDKDLDKPSGPPAERTSLRQENGTHKNRVADVLDSLDNAKHVETATEHQPDPEPVPQQQDREPGDDSDLHAQDALDACLERINKAPSSRPWKDAGTFLADSAQALGGEGSEHYARALKRWQERAVELKVIDPPAFPTPSKQKSIV